MESLVSHGEYMRLCLQCKFQFVYLKPPNVLCIGPQLKQVLSDMSDMFLCVGATFGIFDPDAMYAVNS
jgi:hypothetical protein